MSNKSTHPLATVADISGKVWAVAEDGSSHLLREGDSVYEGEVILPEARAFVVLRNANGADLRVTEGKEVTLSAVQFERAQNAFNLDLKGLIAATEGAPGDRIPSAEAAPAQLVNQGEPGLDGRETPHGFVKVERTVESVSPPAYQFWSFTGNYNPNNQSRWSNFNPLIDGRATVDERIAMPLLPVELYYGGLPEEYQNTFTGRREDDRVLNYLPKALDDHSVVIEGGNSVSGNVLDNDIDGNGPSRVTSITFLREGDGVSVSTSLPLSGSITVDTLYGSLTISSDGNWSYISDPAEIHGVDNVLLEGVEYTISDVDGDKVSALLIIDVLDTIPVTTPTSVSVNEKNLPDGTNPLPDGLIVDGSLGVSIIADAVVSSKFTIASGDPSGLTSNGLTVNYYRSPDGKTLTAYTDNDPTANQVFTVVITETDLNNPQYRFTLLGELDHATVNGTNVKTLSFGYEVTDRDGDKVPGIIAVDVVDDVPVLTDLSPASANEKYLPNGTSPNSDSLVVSGMLGTIVDADNIINSKFTIASGDPSGLTSNGNTINYFLSSDGKTLTAYTGSNPTTNKIFTIDITEADPDNPQYNFTLQGEIDHADANGTNIKALSFGYEVTDKDGDKATGTLFVDIIDDVPALTSPTKVSVNEANLPGGTNYDSELLHTGDILGTIIDADRIISSKFTIATGTASGLTSNGLTINYDRSPDGKTLTAYTGENAAINKVFTVIITEDDPNIPHYSFTLQGDIDHAYGTDVRELDFGYEVTDKDGDKAEGIILVDVMDNQPDITSPEKVTVKEANLADGTEPDNAALGTGGALGTLYNATKIIFTIATGEHSGLTSNGLTVNYFVSPDGKTLLAYTGDDPALNNVFTVIINENNPGNPQYSFTLKGVLDHASENGANIKALQFGYEVTDNDGDTAKGAISVDVVDDIPALTPPSTSVNEANLLDGTDPLSAGLIVGGDLGSIIDADNIISSKFTIATGTASGLTSNGNTVIYELSSDGKTLTAYTGNDPTEHKVFTVVITEANLNDPQYSFTLQGVLDHADANGTNIKALSLGYEVTDKDGDKAQSVISVNVTDDIPVLINPTKVSVNEANLIDGNNPVPQALLVGGALGSIVDADNIISSKFTIASGTSSGLTSNGDTVYYDLSSDGKTLTAYTGIDPTTSKIFTVVITEDDFNNPQYSFTLQGVLDHADANGTNINALSLGYEVTDKDGDKALGVIAVDVIDDITVLTSPTEITLNEANLLDGNNPNAGALLFSGALGSIVNADNVSSSKFTIASGTSSGLTSNGDTVYYDLSSDGKTLTAYTGSDPTTHKVFTVVITEDDLNNPQYSFTLQGVLDHADANGTNINALSLGYEVTDKDGDKALGVIAVDVIDDITVLTSPTEITLNEANLLDGNNPNAGALLFSGALGSIVNADNVSSSKFTIASGTSSGLTSNGDTVHYNLSSDGKTLTAYTGSDPTTSKVFTVVITEDDLNNPQYSFTLQGVLDHTDASGTNIKALSLGYEVTDRDGDKAEGIISVDVRDDIPFLTSPTKVTLNEANLTDGNSSNAGALVAGGALGSIIDADNISSSRFTIATGTASGLTSNGSPVKYNRSSDGKTLTAYTGNDPTASKVFTVVITEADLNNPQYSFTLQGVLDHASINGTNIKALSFGYEVTDRDGDKAEGIISVDVTDDIPLLASPTTVTVNEANLVDGSSPNAGALVAAAALGSIIDADNIISSKFTIATGTASGLTSNGLTVNYSRSADGKTLTAYTGNNPASNKVFTVGITETDLNNPQYSFTLQGVLDHADASGANIQALSFGYEVTDKDGDKAQSVISVNVVDDLPATGTPVNSTLYEKYLPTGSEPNTPLLTTTETLAIIKHSDAIDVTFDNPQPPTGLQSGGSDVQYAVSNSGHTLTATTAAGEPVFTIDINNPASGNATYTVTLIKPLDHTTDIIDLPIKYKVTDFDKDQASQHFTVSVKDDNSVPSPLMVLNEDTSKTITINADAAGNTTITGDAAHGTASVNGDGTITYTPDANYSGQDTFTYKLVNDNGPDTETEVTVTVNPISDQPTVQSSYTIATWEDQPVSLGLLASGATGLRVSDNIDKTGALDTFDNPERLGAITLSNFPTGAKIFKADGTTLVFEATAGHTSFTVLLVQSDGSTLITGTDNKSLFVNGTTADRLLTVADYEGLLILPPPDNGANLTVKMSVTEYEVNSNGDRIMAADQLGKESHTTIPVNVTAVTDRVDLQWNTVPLLPDHFDPEPPAPLDEIKDTVQDGILYKWINEDQIFRLDTLLGYNANDPSDFGGLNGNDADGSEQRWVVIGDPGIPGLLSGFTLWVDGVIKAPESDGTYKTDLITNHNTLPNIELKSPADFSGNISGIKVTLYAQDSDTTGTTNPDGSPFIPLIKQDSVDLNLLVKPVASGDLVVANPAADYPEDTKEIKFLAAVSVTDTSSNLLSGGIQTITSLTVKGIPDGWSVLDPAGTLVVLTLGSFSVDPLYIDRYKEYSITPPAHGSVDAALLLDITTVDNNSDTGTSSYSVTNQPLAIKLTPVAEQFVENSPGNWVVTNTDQWINSSTSTIIRAGDSDLPPDGLTADLRMNPDHTYSATATEGTLYSLFEDGAFSLAANWFKADGITPFNEDRDETTTALFTPTVNGDASLMRDAQFTYAGLAAPLVFSGSAIEIPISKLDSLKFTPPAYYSTDQNIVIKVQAKTVDYDGDHPGDAAFSVTKISGLSLLTIPGILPVDSLLSVNAYSPGGDEDTEIPLYIRPITKDVDGSEKSVVTITDIPDGASLFYNGAQVLLTDMPASPGKKQCTIGTFSDPYDPTLSVSFNPNAVLTFTPPFNSNRDYSLSVTVTSKDTNGFETVTTTLPSVPIDINVRGVADGMVIQKISTLPLYSEAAVDADTFGSITPGVGDNRISLKNLIDFDALQTYLKDDADLSEVATFKITLLDYAGTTYASNDLSLTGTGVELIKGDGTSRIWSFGYADLNTGNVRLKVPEHFSGTVTFDLYPVTTENDGDSLTGVQDAYPVGPINNVPLHMSVEVVPEDPDSIDGTIQLSTTVPEDTLTKVGFAFSGNGDTNETLDWVIIKSASLVGQPFTLYYDDDGAGATLPITLDAAVAAGYIVSDTLGFKVSGTALDRIYVQTAHDLPVPDPSGSTYAFDVQYQITDPATVSGSSDDVQLFNRPYTLTSKPVTDPIVIEDFLAADSKFDFSNGNATVADTPDKGTVTATGSTIITLKVTVQQMNKLLEVLDPATPPSPPSGNGTDIDGSERLVRLLIDGVPDGVTVGLTGGGFFVPATYVGDVGTGGTSFERTNRWILNVDQSFLSTTTNSDGHVAIPLEFALNGTEAELQNKDNLITVTAESRDSAGSVFGDTVTASMSWRLITGSTFTVTDLGITYSPTTKVPAKIYTFAINPLLTSMIEDTPVTLNSLLTYSLINGASPLSIVLTDPPVGTIITGMEQMTVGGVTFWTASVTPISTETADQTLARLLQGITVTAPLNSNSNNSSNLALDLTLTAYGANGVEYHQFAHADLPVAPRTDDTVLTITPQNVNEDNTAPFTVTIKVGPDGNYTELPDGKLYLKLDDSAMDAGGTLLYSEAQLPMTPVTNPSGLAPGTYYVVNTDLAAIKSSSGQTLQFYYVPKANASGSVALTAYLRTHETGDLLNTFKITQQAASITVAPVNDGYTMTLVDQYPSDPAITVIGNENAKIVIPITGLGLTDSDNLAAGSEKILTALLENVPVGYLVYVGNTSTLAINLGDDGSGKNMWRIPLASGATLLPALYIEPPPYVSETIHDLKLTVTTSDKGVTNNSPSTVTFDLQVTPVANGFQLLNPTLSFGVDGYASDVPTASNRILLNLNAGMFDLDGSETVTLSFKGIGNYASFCKSDGSPLPSSVSSTEPFVSYDAGTDTYTLYHIPVYDSSPSNRFDVNNLYLVQSARYVPGVQVSAWTVESANGAASTVSSGSFNLSIATYTPTTGNDTLLYDKEIDLAGSWSYNALAGEDTLLLRLGEGIDFTSDRATLSIYNIETIDLTANGSHTIQNITYQDVLALTDFRHDLFILGDGGDTLRLDGSNGWNTPVVSGDYYLYTNNAESTVALYVDKTISQS